jgi:hypothetical protein
MAADYKCGLRDFQNAGLVVNADCLPTWNVGDEFRPAREKEGVKKELGRLSLPCSTIVHDPATPTRQRQKGARSRFELVCR